MESESSVQDVQALWATFVEEAHLPPQMAALSVDDDLLVAGLGSLQAINFLSIVEGHFGARYHLRRFFLMPTLSAVAHGIAEGDAATEESALPATLVRLGYSEKHQASPSMPRMYALHPLPGTVSAYAPLANELGTRCELWGVQSPLLETPAGGPVKSVADLALGYCADILAHESARDSADPINLVGYSFGAFLAIEVARYLTRTGHSIGSLVLLDTPAFEGEDEEEPQRAAVEENTIRVLAEHVYGLDLDLPSLEGLSTRLKIRAIFAHGRGQGVLPTEVTVDALDRLVNARVSHRLAASRYRPEFLDHAITLVRAADTYSDDVDHALGWREFSAACDVVMLPGDHFTILEQPNVGELAQALARALPAAIR